MSIIQILKILKNKHSPDYFSLIQGYSPLLEDRDIVLFMHLVAKAKVNSLTKSEECDYSKFLDNNKLDYQEVEIGLSKLTQLNLISMEDAMDKRTIKVEKVKPLLELMKDDEFHSRIKSLVTEDKYSELLYLTGEETNVMEGKEGLNKQTYVTFYSGVLDLLGSEFTIPSEAIKLIKQHEDNVPMACLRNYGFMSTIKLDGKYCISSSHLNFLITQHLSENSYQFNIDEHQEFWRNLKSSSYEENASVFGKLFEVNNPITLYQLLTAKEKAPDVLHKWIKTAVQDYHFPYPIVNALMSFVMCLLGRIPINYLSKVSHTIKESYSANKIGIFKWAKGVIESDIRNGKNRLNVRVEKTIIATAKGADAQDKDKFNEGIWCNLYSG